MRTLPKLVTTASHFPTMDSALQMQGNLLAKGFKILQNAAGRVKEEKGYSLHLHTCALQSGNTKQFRVDGGTTVFFHSLEAAYQALQAVLDQTADDAYPLELELPVAPGREFLVRRTVTLQQHR